MEDKEIVEQLINKGFNYIDYVPCSNLKGIINVLNQSYPKLVHSSNNEGESLSNAFAVTLSGKKAVVMLQNSGLGNLLNPYTSLIKIYNAQIFYIIGYRGADLNDEIQHEFMGKITESLLKLMDLDYQIIENDSKEIDFSKNCLLVKNGSVENTVYNIDNNKNELTYEDVIKEIVKIEDNKFFTFATTGFISRTLFDINDNPKNFYNVGAMGNVSTIAKTFNIMKEVPTVVLDGDGSFLMRLENNILPNQMKNKYIYVLLNNGSYNSTGAQTTNINNIKLELLSKSLGFEKYYNITSLNDLHKFKNIFNTEHTKIFINCEINNEHKQLPRIKFKDISHWSK